MTNPGLQPINLIDFTGGINLRRNNFNLADNESPAMENVEIDPRGGFFSRKGWNRWNAADVGTVANWHPRNGYVHSLSDGSYQVYVANNGTLYASGSGASFSDLLVTVASPVHLADFAAWGDTVYIACGMGESSYSRTNSDTPVALGDSHNNYNDDYTVPSGGRMPSCEHVESHAGYLFCAGIYENPTEYPNRLRWSHPSRVGDWATLDYIDIEAGGGKITGLLSFQDHLLIFKSESIWALYGYDSDSWQLIRVSLSAGTPSPTAITSSESAVYFYSGVSRNGIYAYTGGQQVVHLSEKLRTAMEEIDTPTDIWLGWVGRRLWCSIPWLPDGRTGDESSVFVFDPEVGQGAWVRHEAALGALTLILERSDNEVGYPLAAICGHSGAACLVRLEYQSRAEDEILTGDVQTAFASNYRTGWYDASFPERLKSWRRPRMILRNPDADMALNVEAYYDYSEDTPLRTANISIGGPENQLIWDSGWLWDDGSIWNEDVTGSTILRGQPLGHSRALQLRFCNCPSTPGAAWGVDAVTLKYIYRRFTT